MGNKETNMKIFVDGRKKPIISTIVYKYSPNTEYIKELWRSENMKIYESFSWIIYEKNRKFYCFYPESEKEYSDYEHFGTDVKDIITIAKILGAKYGEKYIYNFAGLMISIDDEFYVEELKKLANKSQIDNNEINNYYIKWTQVLLEKYNINWNAE
jgi:hypothetical protein